MTILFSNVLQSAAYGGRVSPLVMRGSLFSLVIGSNFGGNLMIHAALAGLMWVSLVESKGVAISFVRFAAVGLAAVIPVIAAAVAVLYLELLTYT